MKQPLHVCGAQSQTHSENEMSLLKVPVYISKLPGIKIEDIHILWFFQDTKEQKNK